MITIVSIPASHGGAIADDGIMMRTLWDRAEDEMMNAMPESWDAVAAFLEEAATNEAFKTCLEKKSQGCQCQRPRGQAESRVPHRQEVAVLVAHS